MIEVKVENKKLVKADTSLPLTGPQQYKQIILFAVVLIFYLNSKNIIVEKIG